MVRNDIPDLVETNRFFDLFTRSREERPIFVSDDADLVDEPGWSETIIEWDPEGGVFERFELELPEGSSMARSVDGGVQIRTPRVALAIHVDLGDYPGFEEAFAEYYLGKASFDDVVDIGIRVRLNAVFPLRALVSRSGWEQYAWVDSFIETLRSDFSFDAFLHRIQWDSTKQVMRFIRREEAQRSLGESESSSEVPASPPASES